MLPSILKIPSSRALASQMINLMIEAIQGPCLPNQKALLRANIDDTCKEFFIRHQKEDEPLVNLAIKLLYSLLEGSNPLIIKQLCHSLDFDFLISKLHQHYATRAVTTTHFDEDTMQAFNIYLMMR